MMQISTEGSRLVLCGAFDVRSTSDVRRALYSLLDAPEAHVVVDLTGVDSADVTALRVLAAASVYASRQGGHLTLVGCGKPVRRLLHLSRLSAAIEVEATAATA